MSMHAAFAVWTRIPSQPAPPGTAASACLLSIAHRNRGLERATIWAMARLVQHIQTQPGAVPADIVPSLHRNALFAASTHLHTCSQKVRTFTVTMLVDAELNWELNTVHLLCQQSMFW